MKKRIFHHLLFWLVYLYSQIYMEYMWILRFYPDNTHFEVFQMASSEEYFLLLVRVPMVYLTFFLAGRYNNSGSAYGRGIVYILLTVLAATIGYRVLVTQIILPDMYHVKTPEEIFKPDRVVRAFLDLAFVYAAAHGLRMHRSRIKMKEREWELMKQKAETELNLLKSQINPHFLFNTLNNVYGLALKNSPQTAPVVMKLSALMRFMLYESEKKEIAISDEIKLIEDYIELEGLRYNDRLKIDFKKEVDDPSTRVTPLLLLPLVENAFKHGASESRKNIFIAIKLALKGKRFSFEIMNSYEAGEKKEEAKGLGLKSVKRQLELLYSDFGMDVVKQECVFEVKLNIRLDSYAV